MYWLSLINFIKIIGIIFAMIFLQIIFIQIIILLQNRKPDKIFKWLIPFAILPILGVFVYLLFSSRGKKKEIRKYVKVWNNYLQQNVESQKEELFNNHVYLKQEKKKKLVRLTLNNSLSWLTVNNQLEVLTNGESKFEQLLNSLQEAKEHIHMQYYIFRDDDIGRKIGSTLIEKSLAGLEVRLLIDGWGSKKISDTFLNKLRSAGVMIEFFFPVKFPYIGGRLNYRNHRKIVVIDGKIGFFGGMNVGNEYLSRDPNLGFWRDTHFKIIGEAVKLLQSVFINDWFSTTGQLIGDKDLRYFPEPDIVGEEMIQVIPSGPYNEWYSIQQMIFSALTTAENKIYIQTPYFIPDESMMMALKTAALSGIDVRLIYQGVPEYKLTFWASNSYVEELLNAGVKVYLYQKGILHTKIIMIDSFIAIVGSANFDMRSFQLNFEICSLVYDKEFIARLEEDFTQDIVDSVKIDIINFRNRSLGERVKEANSRLLASLL